VVLDGFGIGSRPAADAIAAARMPVWRGLLERWPHARLEASGEAVGLPPGQMGNSEVGHLNIGAGRPVLQDLPRIDAALADGSFFERPALVQAAARARRPGGGTLHVVALVGPGGVHAHDRHLLGLVELAARSEVPRVRIHALLDGRDTPPSSALGFVRDLESRLDIHPDARIASVGGRYFAMDRDRRWERTKAGYDAIVHGTGERAPSATAAIEAAYARGESDEFVRPTVVGSVDGVLADGDPVVHANFRADRARQLTHALADPTFDGFDRSSVAGRPPDDLLVVTMTEYEAGLPVQVAFPPEEARSLAHAVSDAGWTQFHVAETEKYAHVTYFLNGGREAPLPREDRLLVPSPKVATYDLQPEMSAPGVTDALVDAIGSDRYDWIVANYANADMVGHTGVWEATVTAIETIDACLGRVVAAVDALPGPSGLVVTSDHGNADAMRDADGAPVTAHSLNPVPVLAFGSAVAGRRLRDGVLADVAPTLLELFGLPPWEEMTGRSLLV
jgi:2,3-bisphosphoglycerate-independent phosphoglycerate mutase